MKALVLPLFLFMLTAPAMAQNDSVYAYYDKQWSKLEDKTDAAFFRVVKDQPDGRYLVYDYYISGNLQFAATCSALEPELVKEGEAIRYYESGQVKQKGRYEDGELAGLHQYFYEDGTPHKVMFYHADEKPVYHQFWSPEGRKKLAAGKGLAVEYFPDRDPVYFEIEDSVAIASYSKDEAGNSVYWMLEQQPEYEGGHRVMGHDLRAVLKYPESARRIGIEGKVYVSFIVGKTGDVSGVRIVRGLHPECDAEAMRAVSTLNKWQPGMHHGSPVYVRFVLPVLFRIGGE